MKTTISCLLLAVLLAPGMAAAAAELRAPSAAAVSAESEQKLRAAFDHLYNLEFAAGEELFRQVVATEPQSAAARAFLASALLYEILARQGTLQSQLFVTTNEFLKQQRLPPDPELKRRFQEAVADAQRLAQQRLARNPEDADGLFALGLSYGMQANYVAGVEARYLYGVRLGEQGFDLHQKLRRLRPEIHDAAATLGVHDYIIGSLPGVHRFFLFFLGASADRHRGLEYLQEAAARGEFLRTYARVLLAVAWIREGEPERAAPLLESLRADYPRNPLFALELARLYRQQQRYPQATELCSTLLADLQARPLHPRLLGPEDAWLELGRGEAAAGQFNAALDAFRHAEQVAGANAKVVAWALLEEGRLLDQQGQRGQAISLYEKVIHLAADADAARLASNYKRTPYGPPR